MDQRRELISNGKPLLAYLSVHFEVQNSDGSSDAVSVNRKASCTKSITVKALHKCVEHCLEPPVKGAGSGLPATTNG